MDEQRKYAYRQLLYCAMLDIRIYCQSRGRPSRNPFTWYRQYQHSRIAGAIADWLHNLADQASREDFAGFSEDGFWQTHAHFCRRFPDGSFAVYRQRFDQYLAADTNSNATGNA
jgi:hypothetical protein